MIAQMIVTFFFRLLHNVAKQCKWNILGLLSDVFLLDMLLQRGQLFLSRLQFVDLLSNVLRKGFVEGDALRSIFSAFFRDTKKLEFLDIFS